MALDRNAACRLNGEIKRRTEVVGIFPNEDAITRLICAILMEHSDEWAVQRAYYMTLVTRAPVSDDPILMLSAVSKGKEAGIQPSLQSKPLIII